MTNTKLHLNIRQGVLEVEGSEDFVKFIYGEFGAIFLEKFTTLDFEHIEETPGGKAGATAGTATKPAKDPAKKKKTASPPKGQSCRARINIIKEEGYFKSHRSNKEIRDHLKDEKGWTYTSENVGAALSTMIRRGEIKRIKVGKIYKYFWDYD